MRWFADTNLNIPNSNNLVHTPDLDVIIIYACLPSPTLLLPAVVKINSYFLSYVDRSCLYPAPLAISKTIMYICDLMETSPRGTTNGVSIFTRGQSTTVFQLRLNGLNVRQTPVLGRSTIVSHHPGGHHCRCVLGWCYESVYAKNGWLESCQ